MKFLAFLLLCGLCLPLAAHGQPQPEPFAQVIPLPSHCGWQLLDSESETWIDTFCYEQIDFQNPNAECLVLRKNGLWGAVSASDGTEFLEFRYDSLCGIHGNSFLANEGGAWFLLDFSNEMRPLEIDSFYIGKQKVHVYRNGKCGLIDEVGRVYQAIYDGIQPFRLWRAGILDQKYTGLCLVSNQGYLNLVDNTGKRLLPEQVVDIQEDDFGFIRYFNGSWNYLNLTGLSRIETADRDFIPYAMNVYKLYNEDRSRSTLNYKGRIFEGAEDYFYLNDEWIAVREAGRIGVLNSEGNWILRPKYDRVEWMGGSEKNALFRFYRNDSCGMVDYYGVEHIPARYGNIIPTEKEDRFIVFDRQLCGMVNKKGESILPISYDHLQVWDEFVEIQKNSHFGYCTLDGKEILQPIYKNMITVFLLVGEANVPVFFAQKYNNLWQFANKDGLMSKMEFSDFQFGGTAVKGYAHGEIVVFALDETGGVEMEEHFSGLPSVKTGKNDDLKIKIHRSWSFSYLEENQQNGLYGLRFYTQHGLAVKPKYTRARIDMFGNFLCPLDFNSVEPLADSISLYATQHFITLQPSSGAELVTNLVYSSAYLKGGFWSYEALCTHSNGKDDFLTPGFESPFRFGAEESAQWKFMKNEEQVLKYYKGNARICPVQEADMDLYTYFQYRNALDHFRLAGEDVTAVLNPGLGVRFDGGEIRGVQWDNLKETRTIPMRPYVAFSELEEWVDNELIYMKKLNEPYGVLQQLNWPDGEEPLKIEKIKSLKHHDIGYVNIFELEKDSLLLRTVHPEYPSYEFESDSLNLGYFHGRILGLTEDGTYTLRAPNDSLYAEASYIRYVGNAWFALLENGSWRLVNRNGISVYHGNYTEIGNWNGGEIWLSTTETTDIIDSEARLIRRQAAKSTVLNTYLLRVDRPEGAVALNTRSGKEFPIGQEDKFLSNAWVLRSEGKGKFNLLNTFTGLSHVLSADKKPEALGFSVLSKAGSSLSITDTNLRVVRVKKVENYDVLSNGMLVVRNKKGKRLYSENGALLHSYSNATFSQDGNLVLVSSKDTSYFIDGAGLKYTYQEGRTRNTETRNDSPKEEIAPSYTLAQEKDLWGLKHEEHWVISPKYDRLVPASDGNFQLVYARAKMLVDAEFNVLYTGFFDSLTDLGGAYMLIRQGQDCTVIDRGGESIYTIHLNTP